MTIETGGLDRLLSLACELAYVWSISRFLKRHLEGKPWEGRVFGILLFFGYSLMEIFRENVPVPYILYAMCHHGLLTVLIMAVFSEEREKKLLAAVLLAAFTGLVWNFSESFLCCGGLMALSVTEKEPIAVIPAGLQRGILVATYILGITTLHFLSGPLRPAFRNKRKSWYFALSIPLAGILLAVDLANWAASNGILVQDWNRYGLYENQLFGHGSMCLFTGIAMAAAGAFVFGMERLDRAERAEEQSLAQVRYYQMLEEQYSQMEGLRHDMKNHMIALENLVRNRQWQQAGAYLRDMAEIGRMEAGEEATGSLVTDALLYQKRHQALKLGIRWQCAARLPEHLPVKEIDLCMILGNILDNAIEGCCRLHKRPEKRRKEMEKDSVFPEEAPWIRISLGTVKKCLFLEVENPTDLTDISQTGRSRKEDPGRHGLGLANIRDRVAGCGGALQMEVKEGIFTISVLLPLI